MLQVEYDMIIDLFIDKQNCRTCDQVIAELENIDDECDMYGIQLVKLKDPPLAKRLKSSRLITILWKFFLDTESKPFQLWCTLEMETHLLSMVI